jgi:hypothetical protein
MRLAAGAGAVLVAACTAAWPQASPPAYTPLDAFREANRAATQFWDGLDKRNVPDGAEMCKELVRRANAGMARQDPVWWVMAGAMFEEGACVKPDWKRAERLYLRAADAGSVAGMARLVSAYALPVGGRDVAASIWWAHRAGLALPDECSAGDSSISPEDFVAKLRGWGEERRAACTYVAAIQASLLAELASPLTQWPEGDRFEVRIAFLPARGVFSAESLEGVEAGQRREWPIGAKRGDTSGVLGLLELASTQAAARIPVPTTPIPPWRLESTWTIGKAAAAEPARR